MFSRSPFARGKGFNGRMFAEIAENETDTSFVGSDRTSTDRMSSDRISGVLFDSMASSRASTSSDFSYTSMHSGARGSEASYSTDFSSSSLDGVRRSP